jgi:hypothetical protein
MKLMTIFGGCALVLSAIGVSVKELTASFAMSQPAVS